MPDNHSCSFLSWGLNGLGWVALGAVAMGVLKACTHTPSLEGVLTQAQAECQSKPFSDLGSCAAQVLNRSSDAISIDDGDKNYTQISFVLNGKKITLDKTVTRECISKNGTLNCTNKWSFAPK